MTAVENLYDKFVGQRVGNGQCGALTSDYMLYLTNMKYQWAGEPYGGQLPPHTDGMSAWNVYTQTDWNAIGFDYINNPTFNQVQAGDTFYIAPRANLPTGHTGIVASTAGGNITTFEQNVNGALYVQKLPDANSWSWYGGFDGITRPKASGGNNSGDNYTPSEGEIEMYLIQIVDKSGKHKGKWYISDGVSCRYVRTPRMLDNYKNAYGKLNLKIDKMYSSELFTEFGGEKNIK